MFSDVAGLVSPPTRNRGFGSAFRSFGSWARSSLLVAVFFVYFVAVAVLLAVPDSWSLKLPMAAPSSSPMAAPAAIVGKRTLLDEATESSASGSTRKLTRVSTDEAVAKSIRDNFKDMTVMETDGVKIGGNSMREQLKVDKRLNRDNPKKHPMGAKYYKAIRSKFSSTSTPDKKLNCKDDSLPINGQLLKAMIAWKGLTANRAPMMGYLQVAERPNQKELIGILKCFLELKPSSSADQLRCSLDIMRWFHRLSLATIFKEEFGIVQESFDKALVQAHISAKKSFLKPQTFVQIHRDIISLVMPITEVDRILAETGYWSNVAASLQVVCKTKLGMRLFGFALSLVAAGSLQDLVEKSIATLMQQASLDLAGLQKFQKDLVEQAMALPGHESLPERRVTPITYRGVPISVRVSSACEEMDLRLWAAIKSHAVATKQLGALFCEDDLANDPRMPKKVALASDILGPTKEARRVANAALPEGAGKDGQTIKDVLIKKEGALTSIDRTFRIEQLFLTEMVGAGGRARLQEAFLQLLPTKEQAKTMEGVLQAASSLMGSDLFKFCSKEAQASLQAASENISGMIQGRPCTIGDDSTSFLLHVKTQFQFFCRHGAGSDEKLGAEAVLVKFKAIARKEVGTISFEELEPVQVFAYLLPPKESSELDDITAKVIALLEKPGKNDSKAKKGGGEAKGLKSSASSKGASASSASTDIDAAMAMFK